jgi:hypothetical protein
MMMKGTEKSEMRIAPDQPTTVHPWTTAKDDIPLRPARRLQQAEADEQRASLCEAKAR